MKALYNNLRRNVSVTIFGRVWTLEAAMRDFKLLKYSFTYDNFKRWYKLLRMEYMYKNGMSYKQLTFWD